MAPGLPTWLACALIWLLPGITAGVQVPLPQGGFVELSTRGPSAFRLRLLHGDGAPPETPMVGPDQTDASYEHVAGTGGSLSISSDFGSLVLSASGCLSLHDQGGKVIVTSEALRPASGQLILSAQSSRLFGRGASPDDAEELTSLFSSPLVANRGTYVPYYWSPDGYGALGAVAMTDAWKLPTNYTVQGKQLVWNFDGDFDLFLMPSSTLASGTAAYYALTGSPRVPPRYAFGFLASRWGWKSRADVEEVVSRFRAGGFPLDAIIFDFEWFAPWWDYGFEPSGEAWYRDFHFSQAIFPEPEAQLRDYHTRYNLRVGGIRKPRLGNTSELAAAQSRGWLLPGGVATGKWPPEALTYADQRNLNFSIPEARSWYAQHAQRLLDAGMDFWWNDEGESDYFTFHWWNVAEGTALRARKQNKRFYSLNRAWTPGMARLGATVWTGDINATWSDLRATPGMMMNWGLAGAPYVACDTGGFAGMPSPLLMTRWLQVSTFMPTMRVHSVLGEKPHWPWNFGAESEAVMRKALELRYRLVPYHYSLAHVMFQRQKLWIRPLAMEFPEDPVAAAISTQWLDGQILVAPVLNAESQKEVYLPEGLWYPLGSNETIDGPTTLSGPASLDEVPAFVRAGTVLPLGPVLQFTDQLPGGPLEIHVYAGADGSFELIEDDGETTAYEAGAVRRTTFTWSDAARVLSWHVDGDVAAPGSCGFQELFVSLHDPNLGTRTTGTVAIGASGSIDLSQTVPALRGARAGAAR